MSKFTAYQVFVAIVESNSLTKAADQLNLSPSAISKQLSSLEQDLGVTLIDRSTRSISVSDVGQTFYTQCKEILYAVEQAEESVFVEGKEPSGKIRITIPQILSHGFYMKLLSDFTQKYKLVNFEISVSNEYLDLYNEKIDFAFRIGDLKDSGLKAIPLMETKPIVCASATYLEKNNQPLKLSELSEHRLIMPSYLNLSEMRRFLSTLKLNPNIEAHHMIDDALAYYNAILNGMGIGILQGVSAQTDIQKGNLINLFPDFQTKAFRIYLLFKEQKSSSKKLIEFKQFVKSYTE